MDFFSDFRLIMSTFSYWERYFWWRIDFLNYVDSLIVMYLDTMDRSKPEKRPNRASVKKSPISQIWLLNWVFFFYFSGNFISQRSTCWNYPKNFKLSLKVVIFICFSIFLINFRCLTLFFLFMLYFPIRIRIIIIIIL
jgi:hypothetical protein